MSLSSVSSNSASAAALQAMFKSADANNDGQLSSDEFTALGQNLQGDTKSAAVSITLTITTPAQNFSSDMLSSLLNAQHDSHAEKMFASADTDGDGKITAEELTKDLEAHAPKDATGLPSAADMAAKLIKDGDTDGDGALSLDEMKAMKPPGGQHGGPPPADGAGAASDASSTSASSTGASYDPADTNKDGQVSADELIASLQSASTASPGASASSSFGLLSQLLAKLTEGAQQATQATAVTA
jgi:Ca2+-binding EF-hand superfamily protein